MLMMMMMRMMMMNMTQMKLVNSATKFRHGMDKFYQPNSGLRSSRSLDEAIYTYILWIVYVYFTCLLYTYVYIYIYIHMFFMFIFHRNQNPSWSQSSFQESSPLEASNLQNGQGRPYATDTQAVGRRRMAQSSSQLPILVGGLEHLDYFSIYWEFHHPNWRIHIFQRGWLTVNVYMTVENHYFQ